MESLTVRELVDAVKGELVQGNSESVLTGISIDTRTLKEGDLFFALKGEKADGHEYVPSALERGAGGLIISEDIRTPQDFKAAVVKVDDPLWALGELASYYRCKFEVRVVGVTGSVGKTTTKEMIASLLSRKWKVLKNAMNFNNEIGVPLTLLQLERNHEAVVVEMAMRGPGEIWRLASIAKPSIGVITNVGISHIERLGSQGAIADAKSELLAALPAENGLAVLNVEDGYFRVLKQRFAGKTIGFGACEEADVSAANIQASDLGCYKFDLHTGGKSAEIRIPMPGYHNVFNALAAAAVGIGFGMELPEIKEGLEDFILPSMRMELVKSKNGCIILNDSYNASPASMSAALKTLIALKGVNQKIAVLGDMLELGNLSKKSHHAIGASLNSDKIDFLVAVGERAKAIAEGAETSGFPKDSIQCFANSLEAGEKLKGRFGEGDAVLVKGSRGMKMEEIVRAILND